MNTFQNLQNIDRRTLEIAFCYAAGELSTYGKHTSEEIPALANKILERASQAADKEKIKYDPLRRCDILRHTPAEKAITDAMATVEALGADERLTNAVVLLVAARENIANFVDGVDSVQLLQTVGN